MKTPHATPRRADASSRRTPAARAAGSTKATKATKAAAASKAPGRSAATSKATTSKATTSKARTSRATNGHSAEHAVHIGISQPQRQGVISVLQVALANAYLLLVKTKKMHWDIVGPQFLTLHKLWDEQYAALSISTDEIAERIRMLGGYPLGTLAGFLEKSELRESPGQVPAATPAVELLLRDHEAIVRSLRTAIPSCEKLDDTGTADFLTGLLRDHEKMAWELRSFLQGEGVHPSGPPARGPVPSLA